MQVVILLLQFFLHLNIEKLLQKSTSIFPTIAVSVIDNNGSAIPAIVAGIANLFMLLNVIEVVNFFYFMTNS